jgi:hypothetical protein
VIGFVVWSTICSHPASGQHAAFLVIHYDHRHTERHQGVLVDHFVAGGISPHADVVGVGFIFLFAMGASPA